MPDVVQVTLGKALRPPACGSRRVHCPRVRTRNLPGGPGHGYASPPASEGRLDHQRQPVFTCERCHLRDIRHGRRHPRQERRANLPRQLPRSELVTQQAEHGRRRPDPGQPGI